MTSKPLKMTFLTFPDPKNDLFETFEVPQTSKNDLFETLDLPRP
jgi:hypothetical protein